MILIQALDRRCNPIGLPMGLADIVGMAWGVHDDIKNGKRGMIVNQCAGTVYWWVASDRDSLGFAPNGEEMFSWTELDGSIWEEYWEATPGGGLVQSRRVN